MANSTQVRTGLNSLIQSHVSDRLKNTMFDRLVLLYFLCAKEGDKKGPDGLGVPKTGMFLSGVSTAKAKKEQILGARVYEPLIQTSIPAVSDGKVLGMYDTMPQRSNWDTTGPSTYFTRPRFKWCERVEPYQISNKDRRTTTSAAKNEVAAWKGVVSLYQAETTSVMGVHLNWWNETLWGTTGSGAPTNEDAVVWDTLHSLQNAIHDSNTYGGVDRSVAANSYFRGKRVTDAKAADFEDLINHCNLDLELSKKGSGIDLMLVGAANFKKAKKEAKAKGGTVMLSGGIQEFGRFGFSREIVKIDNTWIVYDPECPATHVAALNLSTWTYAIHPDANFKVSKPEDYSKQRGGIDASGGTIRTEMMLACEVPSLNAYFTNVT